MYLYTKMCLEELIRNIWKSRKRIIRKEEYAGIEDLLIRIAAEERETSFKHGLLVMKTEDSGYAYIIEKESDYLLTLKPGANKRFAYFPRDYLKKLYDSTKY